MQVASSAAIRDREIGMILWAGRDSLDEVKALGIRCGQLGVGGEVAITPEFVAEWKAATATFPLYTVTAAYEGEEYADIPTVQRTVGFIPRATRAAREARTIEISNLAAALAIPGIACHIGFVPEDESAADYVAVRDMVRRVCDHCAKHGQTFSLETGQETAAVLKRFLEDVARSNLKINFDPANMILYGTGDPIEALQALAADIVTVHCKDGDWPDTSKPDSLGKERPLGQGSVGIARFVETLKAVDYRAPLFIERESVGQAQRMRDIGDAVKLLEGMRGTPISLPVGVPVDPKSAPRPARITMEGRYVRLEPVDPKAHGDALWEGVCGNDHLWAYLFAGPYSERADFDAYLQKIARGDDTLFYAIVDRATARAVGIASLMRIDPANRVIEVGGILYTPALQQTRGATEAMYLMARYVFDELGYRRYEWKCNDLNAPSRSAALRLGFSYEGIFRQHMILKGRNRDTAWFSMLDSEWPVCKSAFERWLDPANFDTAGRQKSGLAVLRRRD